jgi:hypothetical protein
MYDSERDMMSHEDLLSALGGLPITGDGVNLFEKDDLPTLWCLINGENSIFVLKGYGLRWEDEEGWTAKAWQHSRYDSDEYTIPIGDTFVSQEIANQIAEQRMTERPFLDRQKAKVKRKLAEAQKRLEEKRKQSTDYEERKVRELEEQLNEMG